MNNHNIKKNYKNGLQIFIFIVFISSCSGIYDPFCWGDNKYKGIIIEQSERFDNYCPFLNYRISTIVIKSQDEYIEFFTDTFKEELICTDFLDIDYNKYTLLGAYMGGGSTIRFVRDVQKNHEKKVYDYKITMYSCGVYLKGMNSMNWVLVPRLPDGWDVEFELIEK